MKIYTKTGDDGTTGLIGGVRVSKADLQIESYGTVDELNSWVGLIRDTFNDNNCAIQLLEIQNNLFVLGASLATAPKGTKMQLPPLTSDFIADLESWIDSMNTDLPDLTHFILPGGHSASSHAQVARCVCRRAERRVIELHQNDPRFSLEIQYLNRLSDYLFVLARFILQKFDKEEVKWIPNLKK
ncbi:MAG: cob(I)yrinic acid a,c-diamide adenosyltransferase [Flavobacteriia bacterium]|jgi:cob(I)alamin adenosyltransferase|nr:cob(I)yrinic acid a,c-diamide adenosyltransferase [Flavobacteriia bacterium]